MIRSVGAALLLATGCFPPFHPLEGKLCTASAECGAQLVCELGRCVQPLVLLPQAQMSVVSASISPESAPNVLDGDTATMWESTTLPAELVIDLGAVYAVWGWSYWPYSDWTSLTRYEAYVSNDPLSWGDPVVAADTVERQFDVRFEPRVGRYLRLVYPGGADTVGYCFTSEVKVLVPSTP